MICNGVGYKSWLCFVKFDVLCHFFGCCHTEGWMSFTELDELTVVFVLFCVLMAEVPVYCVDGVRRLIGVVYALFVTEDFFACEHERCSTMV